MRFEQGTTGLWFTHDDEHTYHIRNWRGDPVEGDYWELVVWNNVDGHIDPKGQCHTFTRNDRGEVFRLARSIHDYSEARRLVAA